MGRTQCQNKRGERVPAIPLPLYVSLGRVQCRGHEGCNATFWTTRRYREHYALVHILGLD